MLKFQPKAGSVVYCDYVGFIAPEMVKKRPVVVMSKHKHDPKLLTVVPISKTKPEPILDYHVEMERQFCLDHLSGQVSWVKCDMINVVTLSRLNLVRNWVTGDRYTPNVGSEFLARVKEEVRKVHGL